MPITGQETVLKNITKVGGGFLKHTNSVMEKVRKRLDAQVSLNILLADHGPRELAKLDHPYAARHGGRGLAIHEPYWQVHAQTGRLVSSKGSGVVEATFSVGKVAAKAWVRIDEGVAPHALYVIYGTTKMIPRPFLIGSLEQVREELYSMIRNGLKGAVIQAG
jgi:hypothetical protein